MSRTRHKSLRYTPPADEQETPEEPFTFTIREWDPAIDDIPGADGDPDRALAIATRLNAERTFTAVDELPGVVALELGKASDDGLSEAERMGILSGVVDAMVIESDLKRFDDQLRTIMTPPPVGMKRPQVIRAAELMFYLQQVLEEISGRPTVGQPASAGSLPSTPTGSMDVGENGQATLEQGSPV